MGRGEQRKAEESRTPVGGPGSLAAQASISAFRQGSKRGLTILVYSIRSIAASPGRIVAVDRFADKGLNHAILFRSIDRKSDSSWFATLVSAGQSGGHGWDAVGSTSRCAGRSSAGWPSGAAIGHPVLAFGRAKSLGYVGPQADRAARNSWPLRSDPHEDSWGVFLRAFAAAGFDRRPVVGHPFGRLPRQQSYADHDAGGQSAGATHRRRA